MTVEDEHRTAGEWPWTYEEGVTAGTEAARRELAPIKPAFLAHYVKARLAKLAGSEPANEYERGVMAGYTAMLRATL